MKSNYKILTAVIIIISAFAFMNFSGNVDGEFKMMNSVVIKRVSDGALYLKGKINIKFRDNYSLQNTKSFGISKMDAVLQQVNVEKIVQNHPIKPNVNKRMKGDNELAKIYAIFYKESDDPGELSKRLYNENKDVIEWAEPDYVMVSDFTPNDPSYGSQWFLPKISAGLAWDLSQGDTNVVIGMVDTGGDLDHPDLAGNTKRNWLENPTNGIDDDGNGYIDDWHGWDYAGADYQNLSQDNDPQIYTAYCEHGSHTSGCASEITNNATGGAGIGFKCKLLISKHGADNDNTGGGSSYLYNTNSGLVYCYTNGAKVMNCSFGGTTYSAYTQLVINNAWSNGTVTVASAGNDGLNAPRYPASYDNVVSVAATNSSDTKAWFSNYHSTVDVCAPGQGIYSTVWNNSYTSMDGTSMSSPITAGTVALIMSKFPSYSPTQVVAKLKAGVDDIYSINPGYVGLLGTGRVNAYKCLQGGSDTLIADFSANQTNVAPGGSVNFTDMTTGGPTGWTWTFPGGTPGSSTSQNPTNIVYNTIGTYDVTLVATKGSLTSTRTKSNYITVSAGSVTKLNESFENTTFPPTGWSKINPTAGAATGWYRVTAGTTPVPGFQGGLITTPNGGGTAVAFCNYITGNASGGSSGLCDQWLITPQITNITAQDSLTFYLRKFGTYAENFWVRISTTTPTVAAMTIPVMTQAFSVSDSGWVQYKFNIGSLVPVGANIYIGFREYVTDVAVDGASFSLDLVRVTSPSVGITRNESEIPISYSLSQNYPNPFNPTTNIKFALPKSSQVKLSVFDLSGKEVAVLVNDYKNAGTYIYQFDASGLSSGVYFYKISAGNFVETKRMIVIK